MPLTKFKLSSIADGGISTAKLADGAVTLDKTDSLFVNTEISGTEAAKMPVGTTAQREGSPKSGDIRFNSTLNLMEYYDGTNWKAIDSPPTISGVSPSTFDAVGDTITISGSNFQTGVNVTVIGSDGTSYTPDSVTRNSSSEVTFDITSAILNGGLDAFDVVITNTSGLSVTSADALTIPNPTASFTSNASFTLYDASRSSGFDAGVTLTGDVSEPDVTVSYALTAGTLPSGASLNTSTGAITGINAVGSDTTSNFTITATVADASQGTSVDVSRAFALTVAAPVIQTFNYTGSDQTFTVPSGASAVQVYMWGAAGGGSNAEGYQDAGGPGGYSDGLIDVSGISSLVIQVGSGGGVTSGSGTSRPSRPYPNGGLPSLRSSYDSGAGGGRSAIFNSSVSFANALIVAGGGGGAGGHGGGSSNASNGTHGGSGGGTSGTNGSSAGSGVGGGADGGTQSSGGVSYSATRPLGRNGDQLQGADAGDGQQWSSGFNAAGGGGDGYYGGGAKDDVHGGGGGGSGYLHPTLVSSGQTLATTSPSGKQSTINPPQTGSSYYTSGVGRGNSNSSGGNGKVVIKY